MKLTLRDYQRRQLDAVAECLKKGTNRVLIKSPTGTGKTVMFSSILEHPPIARWLEQFPKGQRRMMVIAHREELLDQAAQKIQLANPGLLVGVEQAGRYAHAQCDVVVASIQTLAARQGYRLRRLMNGGAFRVVIVDEAHHAAASTYRTALAHLGFLPLAAGSDNEDDVEAATFEDTQKMEVLLREWDATAPRDRVLVGVTATPNRTDAIGLGCVFQTLAYSYGLRQAIDDGWLVPLTAWAVDTRDNLDDVKVNRGEFNQKDLAAKVNNAERNELAVAAWLEHAHGRSTLAFTVDVQHAHDLAEAFTRHGIHAEAVSGETPKEERRDRLARFSAGRLQVLTNCMVLTEGTDLPRAACILHAKPTKSPTLYEQMTGRGLRVLPPDPAGPERKAHREPLLKEDCIIIDLVDVARRHSLQAAPILYGLPPRLKVEGKDLAEAAEELDDLLRINPGINADEVFAGRTFTLAELARHAEKINIWAVPDLGTFGKGRTLKWMKIGEDTYRMEYPWQDGFESLTVQKDLLEHWEVVVSYRISGQKHSSTRTIAAQVVTADAAAGLAEGFVQQERASVARMRAVDAGWMKRPATPKQLDRLRQWRIPHDPRRLSAGQASDLIDLWFARRARRSR